MRATIEVEREKLIEKLGVAKKEKERRDINFKAIDRLRVLFAWCLPEQSFVSQSQSQPRMLTADDGDDMVPLFSGNARFRPRHENEDAPDCPVEISMDSVTYDRPLQALVTCGPKQQRPGNGAGEGAIRLPFVVRVDLATLEAVESMDEVELACYMSEHFPRPFAVIEDRDLAARLLMNQIYPRGARAKCQIVAAGREGYEVKVLQPVAVAGDGELLDIDYRRRRDGEELDMRDLQAARCGHQPSKSRAKPCFNVDEQAGEQDPDLIEQAEDDAGESGGAEIVQQLSLDLSLVSAP